MVSTQSIQLPFILLFFTIPTKSTNTIIAALPLKDNKSTILSSGGNFELEFFVLGGSDRRFFGIWYKKISLLTPFGSPIGICRSLVPPAPRSLVPSRLALFNGAGEAIWSTNSSKTPWRVAVVVQLMDTGNLVLREDLVAYNGRSQLLKGREWDDYQFLFLFTQNKWKV